ADRAHRAADAIAAVMAAQRALAPFVRCGQTLDYGVDQLQRLVGNKANTIERHRGALAWHPRLGCTAITALPRSGFIVLAKNAAAAVDRDAAAQEIRRDPR